MALVALWVTLAARGHTALHHDMAEQFVWAQQWQLGYPKHPPLPTWLFKLVLCVLPPVPATLYALSAVCIGLTGVFTYLAARTLLGARSALFVLMLWALQQPFSWRAWIYNHNTVLVMTVALTVWCAAVAARQRRLGWWLAAGVGAGLAMSTKLQALVPLFGVVWALWRTGAFGNAHGRRGLVAALAMAAVVSAAPLWWMLTGHTNAMAYATHQLGSGQGEGDSVRLVQFVVSELRMMWPSLVVLLAWVAWAVRQGKVHPLMAAAEGELNSVAKPASAWVQGLLLLPLAFVLLMGLVGGAKLHAQWGVQTFQFLAFALVVWFEPFFKALPWPKAASLFAGMQVLGLVLAAAPVSDKLHAPGAVQGYPSAELAKRVSDDWARLAPGCPLRFVDAPFFEGGQLAAYVPGMPAVRDAGLDERWQPVRADDMAQAGSVVLRQDPAALPADAIHSHDMFLMPPLRVKGVNPVAWGIRLPLQPCAKR